LSDDVLHLEEATEPRRESAAGNLWRQRAVVVVVAVVAHGLLVLNDGVYWDGWLIRTALEQGNWERLEAWFLESGELLTAYLHWAFSYFDNFVFWYRALGLLSIVGSAVLVFEIGRESKLVSPVESMWVATLFVAYPAFQASVSTIVFPYLACQFLFFLAIYLFLISEKISGTWISLLKTFSVVIFAASFSVNSFLVFFYGFLILLWLISKNNTELSFSDSITLFLKRNWFLFLVPIVVWFFKRIFFPNFGYYASYNQFHLSRDLVFNSVREFMTNSVLHQFAQSIGLVIRQPALWVVLLLGLVLVLRCRRHFSGGAFESNPRYLFAFGAVLFALGAFPYLAVAKAPSVSGWDTRHALLVALPVAILSVASIRMALKNKVGSFSKAGLGVLAALVLCFTVATIDSYLAWQMRSVKDHSIVHNLRALDGADEISVFWIDDRFPAGGEPYYRFYEWASIFGEAWGGETRVGLDTSYYGENFLNDYARFFTDRYNLSDFDPNGKQARLVITRGQGNSSEYRLVFRYFGARFLHPEKMSDLLKDVAHLELMET
jgi:hypothetical protein